MNKELIPKVYLFCILSTGKTGYSKTLSNAHSHGTMEALRFLSIFNKVLFTQILVDKALKGGSKS